MTLVITSLPLGCAFTCLFNVWLAENLTAQLSASLKKITLHWLAENLTAQLMGSHRGTGRGIEIPEM